MGEALPPTRSLRSAETATRYPCHNLPGIICLLLSLAIFEAYLLLPLSPFPPPQTKSSFFIVPRSKI